MTNSEISKRNLINTNKQKGYVLVLVLIMTFILSLTVTSSAVVVYRYLKIEEQNIITLQEKLYKE